MSLTVTGIIMEDEARQPGHLVLQVAHTIREIETGERGLHFASDEINPERKWR